MESHRNSATNAIGFSLLPSELIQYIILNLALPEITRLKSINKSIASVISDENFVRQCNLQSSSSTWLFIYKKRWHRDSMLHGFTDHSDRWFKISIAGLLDPIIPPGEDLYFLTASGNYFLFALNSSQEVISVNPMTKTVKKIPPSPLGPRGTSSWRRSARENIGNLPRGNRREDHTIFLSVVNGRNESILIAVDQSKSNKPVIVRPRLDLEGNDEGQLAVGFSWGNVIDRLHVYGDGNMMIVRLDSVDDTNKRSRVLKGVELWGLSSNGRKWEFSSKVPNDLIEKIKRPYGVIMGCLEERDGIIRAVLVSNFEGIWDIIWLCYDIGKNQWNWVAIPECKMKGLNMAGITFSSGLSLS
ncbi:hypothetical protein F0562_030038 [Nyssa sinensis]|uniref:F-box domain-containing protein n=1 Tax=Nyssa sinensis TaxID=561372 RepID=A0A5J5AV57_9ASTE|nr:hypothetical protein F0562_030038 [Nyssa sinensis]